MSREAQPLNKALLRADPLPRPSGRADKDMRGRALVIGGSVETPGALLLAGVAALRAGAGKLQLATCASVAPMLALALPEALVAGLAEEAGAIAASASKALLPRAGHQDAVLLGPGMAAGTESEALTAALLGAEEAMPPLVLDAAALGALDAARDALAARGGQTVLTPHAGEMARMLGLERGEVEADAPRIARLAAERFQAVVALKGPDTYVAAPDGRLFRYTGGDVGLATSGSGDTLAGIVAGFLARGASPLTATCWGVYVHGRAGQRLARTVGRIGFLARELLAEVPRAIARLEQAD